MTGYKALLALSESHTKKMESLARTLLAQKRQRQKRQEELDQKQRDLETRLRLQYFEEQKKNTNAGVSIEVERVANEAELLRRDAVRQNTLRYGSKHGSRPRRVLHPRLDDFGGGIDESPALTRKEKRERKLQVELGEIFAPPQSRMSRPAARSRRLLSPQTLPHPAQDPAAGSLSVKARLTASIPNTFTRLNIVKRDIRTIDEIVQANHKNRRVLEGDCARGFDDWFGNPSRSQHDQELHISQHPSASTVIGSGSQVRVGGKKRPLSVRPTPAPVKRRRVFELDSSDGIQALLGRNKVANLGLDVDSDVGGTALMDTEVV